MIRVLRVILALEGLYTSWKAFSNTRKLEVRREHGDQNVKDAVALTSQARLFEIPNGLSASGYFALMAFLATTGLMDRRYIRSASLVLAWLSLGVSAFLIYQLLFALRKNCPLCMRAHALNLALTLTVTAKGQRQARRRR